MNFRRQLISKLRNQPAIIRDIVGNKVEAIEKLLFENNIKYITDQNRRTPLHLAASLGRSRIVELLLLKECYSVNYRDNDLVTPLHRACRNNHSDTVRKLLEFNAEVNIRSRHHITPLHVCCAFDSLECAQLIIDSVHNINATDSNGATALHYAVFKNNLAMIGLLLEHGAQTDVQDKYGHKPIHFAAISNNPQVVQILVEAGSDVNVRNKDLLTPLHLAIDHRCLELFLELLKFDANLEAQDIHGNMPLHWAAYMGCEEIFNEITKRMGNVIVPNLDGITPLHFACYSPNGLAVAIKIMDSISDVDILDKFNRTSLHFAAMNGRNDTASELIVRGANCDRCDVDLETPLHKAAQKSHRNMIKLLICNKASVDVANKDGFTALHLAVSAGFPWNCEFLIKVGANPLACDSSGRTPHYLAVFNGVFDCLLSLMTSPHYAQFAGKENAMPFPELDAFKRSLLHYAAASNTCSHGFIELLLCRRSMNDVYKVAPEVIELFENAFRRMDINQKDIYGRTPLHYVCLRKIDIESDIAFLVQILIEAGADCSIMDNDLRLPFHFAVAQGYISVFDLLFKPEWTQNPADYNRFFTRHCPLKIAAFYGNCVAIMKLIAYGFQTFEEALEVATKRSNWNCAIKLKDYVLSRPYVINKMATLSATYGYSNGLRIFLGCNTSTNLNYLLFKAAASTSGISCLEVLAEKGANLRIADQDGRNLLFYAVLAGDPNTVKSLLLSGVRLVKDNNEKNVFHLIASTGNVQLLKLFHILSKENDFFENLCQLLISKDNDGFSPIEVACVKSQKEFIEYYLTHINPGYERTLLHFAAFVGNYDFIKYIFHKNDSVILSSTGAHNRNLLHYCCLSKRSNLPLLKLLVEDLKFSLTDVDSNGFTPLLCTASVGNSGSLRYLLECNESNLLVTDRAGNTALHLACLAGSSRCACLIIQFAQEKYPLLEKLIFSKNNFGQTTLHLASKKSLKKVIHDLICNGASVSEPDNYDYTPSMYCARDALAANCLKMIESIMEDDIRREANESDCAPCDVCGQDDSILSNTMGEQWSRNNSIHRLSSRQSKLRQSLPGLDSLIESRIRTLNARNSSPLPDCDKELLQNSTKNNLKDTPNFTDEEKSDITKINQQSNKLERLSASPINNDNLVDSDSEMF